MSGSDTNALYNLEEFLEEYRRPGDTPRESAEAAAYDILNTLYEREPNTYVAFMRKYAAYSPPKDVRALSKGLLPYYTDGNLKRCTPGHDEDVKEDWTGGSEHNAYTKGFQCCAATTTGYFAHPARENMSNESCGHAFVVPAKNFRRPDDFTFGATGSWNSDLVTELVQYIAAELITGGNNTLVFQNIASRFFARPRAPTQAQIRSALNESMVDLDDLLARLLEVLQSSLKYNYVDDAARVLLNWKTPLEQAGKDQKKQKKLICAFAPPLKSRPLVNFRRLIHEDAAAAKRVFSDAIKVAQTMKKLHDHWHVMHGKPCVPPPPPSLLPVNYDELITNLREGLKLQDYVIQVIPFVVELQTLSSKSAPTRKDQINVVARGLRPILSLFRRTLIAHQQKGAAPGPVAGPLPLPDVPGGAAAAAAEDTGGGGASALEGGGYSFRGVFGMQSL